MNLDEAFKRLPTFVTDRLQIRPMEDGDAEAIFEFKSDPKVTESYGQEPISLEETRRWVKERVVGALRRESMFWVLMLRSEPKAIGECCLWNFNQGLQCAELGYELHASHWGKGIMTEALPPVLTYGFEELGLHRIEACPFGDNEASKSLLVKLGFKYEGKLRQRYRFKGRYLDLFYYAALTDEWKSERKQV